MNGFVVVVGIVVVEHCDVGERPISVHRILEVGIIAGYAKLEIRIGNAERIHYADVHRAVARCISHR